MPAPRPEGHRTLLKLGCAAAAGILLGLALVVPPEAAQGSARLRLYGELLPDGTEAADAAVARAEHQLSGWFNLDLPNGESRRVAQAALGVEVDRSRLRRLIRDTARSGASAVRPDARPRSDAIDLVVPVVLDRQRALVVLLALKEELDQPASDARLDVDSRAVVPERVGRRLDVDGTLLAIESALENGSSAAPLAFQTEAPVRQARELADVRHEVLLGSFDGRLDASPRSADRRFNLALAASKLDGYVLTPGAVFDFNAVVGPRDEASGYRVAAMAAAGERVDGSGGSTSHLSGALHAAALFAGLDVVERHPPARRGAIEPGLDAEVAYPVTNLRLRNPHAFPVVIRAMASDDRVRAEVRGPERAHTVSVLILLDRGRRSRASESADARGSDDGAVAQRAEPAVALRRYRIRRDGAHAIREVLGEHYPPMNRLSHLAVDEPSPIAQSSRDFAPASSAASTAGRPSHVDFPPERAIVSELTVFSQTDEPSAAVAEQRIGRRFFVPMWAKDIGAPAWSRAREGVKSGEPRPRAGEF